MAGKGVKVSKEGGGVYVLNVQRDAKTQCGTLQGQRVGWKFRAAMGWDELHLEN